MKQAASDLTVKVLDKINNVLFKDTDQKASSKKARNARAWKAEKEELMTANEGEATFLAIWLLGVPSGIIYWVNLVEQDILILIGIWLLGFLVNTCFTAFFYMRIKEGMVLRRMEKEGWGQPPPPS